MLDNRPIGVFDSGVGGLTVLQAVHELLPNESTLYLGDLARFPYGSQPQSAIREYAVQIGDLLAHLDIKMLVIACNTATAAAYAELVDRYPFPVIGVIEPGAHAAVYTTMTGRIGVIATDGTVASGAYRSAILAEMPNAMVIERSASWLVPLIERGTLARSRVIESLAPVLSDLCAHRIDTLILGCTHFPLVRDIFAAEIGADIVLLDSAVTTAQRVADLLAQQGMCAAGPARYRLLVTGPAEAFAERAQAMFHASPMIETVDLVLT